MLRFVVDTSVWIDFFRGALEPSAFKLLSEGIRLQIAGITDVIHHEILVGARNQKEFVELRKHLSLLECLRISNEELPSFDEFAWNLKQKGFKGKYTDSSIAFLCHQHAVPLFTFDGYFRSLAAKGIVTLI